MPLALALAETESRGVDVLKTAGGLARWLEQHGDAGHASAGEVALRVADFRALRDAVRAVFLAAARAEQLPPESVARLNESSARVPRVLALDPSAEGGPAAVEVPVASGEAAALLAEVARSAIELLGGADRARLRLCGASGCGRLFVASRADRAWCSEACGNRERVARHYARSRASGPQR